MKSIVPWWIIWIALMMGVLTYAAILHFMAPPPEDPGASMNLLFPLIMMGILNLGISFAVRFLVTPKLVASGSPQAVATYIISLAMAESVAIFGLVLGFTGATFMVYSPFMLVSFAALLFQSPKVLNP